MITDTTTADKTTDDTTMTDGALYRLMTWLSPAFPVGAYAYSHGIEFAAEDGLVTDRDSLAAWIRTIIVHGAGRADTTLLRAAWNGVRNDDPATLRWAAEWGQAVRATTEAALESHAQGQAFVDALRAAWPDPRIDRWAAVLSEADIRPSYAVAVGIAAALADVPLRPAIVAFLNALAANLVSAGVRIIPLGQTDGQRVLAALEEPILMAAHQAMTRPADDLATAAPLIDWTMMKHETQYTRLFRS